MWSQKIYILFLTKITEKKHTILFLESTNLFTIYSYETSLNVLSRFSLKISSEREVFLLIFTFFTNGLHFFTYYGTKSGIYQALLANTI